MKRRAIHPMMGEITVASGVAIHSIPATIDGGFNLVKLLTLRPHHQTYSDKNSQGQSNKSNNPIGDVRKEIPHDQP